MSVHKFKVVMADDVPLLPVKIQNMLNKKGIRLVISPCRTEEEVILAAHDADGIITEYAPVTNKVIRNLEKCRIIAAITIGVDNIDVGAAVERKIYVSNAPDSCVEEVSEHTLAFILACARKIVQYDRQVRLRKWNFLSLGTIHGLRFQTLGLVGFGKIARSVAKKAKAFGLRVISCDPLISQEIFKKHGVKQVDLEELLSGSDYISIHVPLVRGTRHLISGNEIGMMKSSAFLINTSRGGVVNTEDLCRALAEGKIAGASLDVLEVEPPCFDHPLFGLENVIFSPHAAFYSQEAMEKAVGTACQEVIRVLKMNTMPKNHIGAAWLSR